MTFTELLSFPVPDPVVDQIQAVSELCRNSAGRIDVEDAARVMDRDKRSLLNSMQFNHCPFGFVSADKARHATIPVAKFYMWFMCDILSRIYDEFKA